MKVVLFANTDWYLYNFRLPLAQALRERGDDVLLISPSGDYALKMQKLGFRWRSLPMQRRSLNPVREIGLLVHLSRLFRDEAPDLVHGFTIKCAVYGALAARFARIPARVSSVAGLGYVFSSGDARARLLRPAVRALMRFSLGGENARLILQNNDDVALFEGAGVVDPAIIRLIKGSGVDCDYFRPLTLRAQANEACRVLLAARLLWDKGIAEYVAAAVELTSRDERFAFLLAGNPDPGNPAAVPTEQIGAWQADGLIEWLGHVDDMRKLYASVDLVALPSYREGLPKSLIEAAACGLPLVTTDVPGCREVVTNEVCGLLVPPRDATALALAIERIADNPDRAAQYGSAARERAEQQFDVSIVLDQTLATYDELLEPKSCAD